MGADVDFPSHLPQTNPSVQCQMCLSFGPSPDITLHRQAEISVSSCTWSKSKNIKPKLRQVALKAVFPTSFHMTAPQNYIIPQINLYGSFLPNFLINLTIRNLFTSHSAWNLPHPSSSHRSYHLKFFTENSVSQKQSKTRQQTQRELERRKLHTEWVSRRFWFPLKFKNHYLCKAWFVVHTNYSQSSSNSSSESQEEFSKVPMPCLHPKASTIKLATFFFFFKGISNLSFQSDSSAVFQERLFYNIYFEINHIPPHSGSSMIISLNK